MTQDKNFTRYLILAFFTIIGFLGISIIVSIVSLTKISEVTENIYKHPFTVTENLSRAENHLDEMRDLTRKIMLTEPHNQEDIEMFFVSIDKEKEYVYKNLMTAKDSFLGDKVLFDRLFKSLDSWDKLRKDIIKPNIKNSAKEIEQVISRRKEITELIKPIKDFAKSKAESFFDESTKKTKLYKIILISMLSITILVTSVFGFFITKLNRKKILLSKELKEALENLEWKTELLSQFVKFSPVYIFIKDEKMKTVILSDNYKNMLGRPLEECIGKTTDELFPPQLAMSILKDDLEVMNTGKTLYKNEELNGNHYFTAKYPIKIHDETKYIAGFTLDVTEQHIAEYNLRERVKELKTLFDLVEIINRSGDDPHQMCQEFIGIIGGGWQYPKATCAKIIINDKEFISENFAETEWKQEANILNDKGIIGKIRVCYLEEKPQEYEGPFLKEERDLIEELARKISGYIEHNEDQKKLLVAKNEAEKANKAKTAFLSNMSHEIRTPMTGIMGFVEILKTEEKDEEKLKFLDIILESSNHLLTLINEILSLSKIEAGKLEIHKSEIDLKKFISLIKTTFTHQTKAKEIDFIVEEGDLPKKILADKTVILQILNNLISNAIKFTESGYVKLKINHITYDDLDKTSRNKIEFIIIDTGIGINREKQEKMFEPFVQGENILTKDYGGTGLGLSIVKSLVDLLGGEIYVETEIDKGTSITVRLPYDTMLNSFEINKEGHREQKKSIKIVLAEDDEYIKILMKIISEMKGWNLTIVDNGKELIEQLEKDKYDLILTDIQMPVMNGVEATKLIRKDSRYKNMPIIGLSAFALQEDVDNFMESGMNSYVTKPISIDILEAEIYKTLDL